MNGEFGRWFVISSELAAVKIGDDQIFRSHRAFAESLVCSEDMLRIQTTGNIPVTGGNESALIEPVSRRADILAVFGLRLLIGGRNVIGAHFNFGQDSKC